MARSVQTIQNSITTIFVAAMAAIGITINPPTWSRRNKQQVMINTFAIATAAFEQINDAYTENIENAIASASPQSYGWFQAMMLAFQFNSSVPQVVQYNTTTFAFSYPVVNTSYQVIAFASVTKGAAGTTNIKVAALVNGAPGDLDTAYPGALEAASAYSKIIGVPGLVYNVTSGAADRLFMQMDVYYNGLYSAVIQANVIAAINGYMQTQTATNPNGIPFNGVLTLSNLEAAIKAVPGVNDIIWGAVYARKASTIPPAYDSLLVTANYNADGSIYSNTQLQRNWATAAGYIIPEDTTGENLLLTDYRAGSSGPLNLNLISQ